MAENKERWRKLGFKNGVNLFIFKKKKKKRTVGVNVREMCMASHIIAVSVHVVAVRIMIILNYLHVMLHGLQLSL